MRPLESGWKLQLADLQQACGGGSAKACADLDYARRFGCGASAVPAARAADAGS
jgi:hypothetical protein